MLDAASLITPDWPAPPWVYAFSTTRRGGRSLPPHDSLNLSNAGSDDPAAVRENRRRLRVSVPGEPIWLKQVHGHRVIELAVDTDPASAPAAADGAVTSVPGLQCVVLTADCLPLLICDAARRRVAAVHAGWRGLAAGVVEAALAAMAADPARTLVWLGPAIGPARFEVGADVVAAFCNEQPDDRAMFDQRDENHWLADLPGLATNRLARAGFHNVYASGLCTYEDADRFYSYRRDRTTGRMATGISLLSDRGGQPRAS
ncbi:MAG: peptidoglycan editing factor PgeF [Pseudomonadota bacterium]